MVTHDGQAMSNHASDDLVVRAHPGDIIRWRAISITDDKESKIAVGGFTSVNTQLYTQPVHIPSLDLWQSSAIAVGSDTYWVNFNATYEGTTCYFWWDPGINISLP